LVLETFTFQDGSRETVGFKSQISSSWQAISEYGCHQMMCHTILLAVRHKRAHHALIPASKAGTRFTYPGGIEGWVDLHVQVPWFVSRALDRKSDVLPLAAAPPRHGRS